MKREFTILPHNRAFFSAFDLFKEAIPTVKNYKKKEVTELRSWSYDLLFICSHSH